MRELRGKRAAITGAGSGIGRALAVALAHEGVDLVLADRDAGGLAETAQLVATRDVRIDTYVVDVGDEASMNDLARRVRADAGCVDILINNAGVALYGSVMEISSEEFAWLMNVNFWGVVYGVKAFLPMLLARPQACIVNMSSLFGLWAPPGQSAYAASKFAVRGYSESLRAELLKTGVRVVTVHPAGVATAIAKKTRVAAAADQARAAAESLAFDRHFLTMDPRRAAGIIIDGIKRGRERVLVGKEAHRVDLLTRVLGSRAARLFSARIPFDTTRNQGVAGRV